MIPTQYSLFAGAAHDPRARLAAGLGEYDEMVSGDGRIRAHWRPLVGALQTIPEGILSERVERIYRQYQDTALAFSVENDRQTTEIRRPFDVVDRKSTRLNSSHITISYAVFCLKKK